MSKNKITIYTDGAARGNPGRAGWAAVVLFTPTPSALPLTKGEREGVLEIGGSVDHATNNQMELTAPIQALKYLKTEMSKGLFDMEIEVISDSKYVVLGITEWIHGWLQNNWRNANRKPVMNRELWEELYELTQELKPKWTYIEGHSGHEHNDRADLIATSFADGEPVKLKK